VDQLVHARRNKAHSIFVDFDLLGNTNPHRGLR
jgi:hypothetical protein